MRVLSVKKNERPYPQSSSTGSGRYRRWRAPDWKGYNSKPRLYVWVKDESLLSNLACRSSRPVFLYRKFLPAILKKAGLPEGTKANWSQHAGCSMCPCSPGFILRLPEDYKGTMHFDISAEVTGSDAVAERTEEAAALVESRTAQVLGDPTLAPLLTK